MKKVLITGANKSIGYETARQLLQKCYYVYLGSRTTENGEEAVKKLKVDGKPDQSCVLQSENRKNTLVVNFFL